MENTNTTNNKKSAAVRKSKQLKYRITKAIIQIVFFLLMPSAFVAGFNGIKNIFQWVGQGEVLQLNSFVIALIGIAIFTIICGRFFCGYVCAFGATGDLMGLISELFQTKLIKKKKKFCFPEKLRIVLQCLKYVNLLFIVVMCILGAFSKLTGNSAWDIFSIITARSPLPEGYTIGIISLIIVLVASLFQDRFFCQFLCPFGAFLSLLPVLNFGRIRRNESNCIKGCKICSSTCPAALKLQKDGHRTGECISCGRCKPVCLKGNIAYIEESKVNQYLPVIIRAAAFFILGCFLGLCRLG